MVDNVSPFPAACNRVKKSGKRKTPTHVARKNNNPQTNDKIIMAAVGAGFTWGGVLTEL